MSNELVQQQEEQQVQAAAEVSASNFGLARTASYSWNSIQCLIPFAPFPLQVRQEKQQEHTIVIEGFTFKRFEFSD